MHNRDIVAIGASAGGVEALRRLAGDLPADLPAAVFVVLHIGDAHPTHLAEILAAAGPMPAQPAVDGEPIRPGRIYVAVSDRHLMLGAGRVLLRRGARENRFRPAVDPLFRSAAMHYGGRVIGVVLTGYLNDGASGLHAIKQGGGLAVVQDPADAVAPDMPRSALRHTAVDHCVPIGEMGGLLRRLTAERAGASPPVPAEIRREVEIATQEQTTMKRQIGLGPPSIFTCPDCQGPLWETQEGGLLRYRCHIGHALTADALLAAESDDLERALSSALRSHKERTELLRRMAESAEEAGRSAAAATWRGRAAEAEGDAEAIRRVLVRAAAPEFPAETVAVG